MRKLTKFLALFISLAILVSVNTVSNAVTGGSTYLGSYPQTKVTDETLITAFETLTLDWQSYGYYAGDEADGNHAVSDYMQYADFTYDGEKYRAVTFSQYRDGFDTDVDDVAYTYQDDNGYELNTVYYFKFEPVKWNILDSETGLALADIVIDSQPFSKTSYRDQYGTYYKDAEFLIYSNNYAESTIRSWLNNEFYNTTFTDEEKAKIAITTCENVAADSKYEKFNSAVTNDKVFLLSQQQVENTDLGFSEDADRMTLSSDYAKCQGAFATNSKYPGFAYWWTRSPGDHSQGAKRISFLGRVMGGSNITYTATGVRPAITISNGSAGNASVTVSGTVTSFLTDTDEIQIILTKSGETACLTKVTGNSASYLIEGVEAGEYTLTVSKKNHVTRNYEIIVGNEDVTQDVKIHLLGDINGDGKITVVDYCKLLKHTKKTELLQNYEFSCGDVDVSGNITVVDYSLVLKHVKKTASLW